MVRNLVRLFEQAPIYEPASAPIRWRRQGDPFSYRPAPLNRASRLLPPGKGRGGIRSAPASPIARARACALRLRRFRVAPRPDAPAVRRRWSSGCSRQAASHLPCGKVSRRDPVVKRRLSGAPRSWHRRVWAPAVVAQGQSTSLVRTGSVVRFHSTAPLFLCQLRDIERAPAISCRKPREGDLQGGRSRDLEDVCAEPTGYRSPESELVRTKIQPE